MKWKPWCHQPVWKARCHKFYRQIENQVFLLPWPRLPGYRHVLEVCYREQRPQFWNKETIREFFDGKKSHRGLQFGERLFLDDRWSRAFFPVNIKSRIHTDKILQDGKCTLFRFENICRSWTTDSKAVTWKGTSKCNIMRPDCRQIFRDIGTAKVKKNRVRRMHCPARKITSNLQNKTFQQRCLPERGISLPNKPKANEDP